jgi:hypothetical protein
MRKSKKNIIILIAVSAAVGIGSVIYYKTNQTEKFNSIEVLTIENGKSSSSETESLEMEQQGLSARIEPSPWSKDQSEISSNKKQSERLSFQPNADLVFNQKAMAVLSEKMKTMTDADRQDPLKVAKIIDELQAALGTSNFQGIKLDVIGENLRSTDKLIKEAKKIESALSGIDVTNMKEKDYEKIRSLNIQPLTEAAKQINPKITDNQDLNAIKK